MRRVALLLLFCVGKEHAVAQELFIQAEAASTLPKNAVAIRLLGETFQEAGDQKYLLALRLMYGVSPKLSVYASAVSSNHHGKRLPFNFIQHTHGGNGTRYFAGQVPRGIPYAFNLNGLHLYAKYRLLTFDHWHGHLRVAVYGEWSHLTNVHDEAEPELFEDTPGWGTGLIATYLKNKLALSITSGCMFPRTYTGLENNRFSSAPPKVIDLEYGNAQFLLFSAGYLVSPKVYSDYNQSNWNVYTEILCKRYAAAKVYRDGLPIANESRFLQQGAYVEAYLGLQHIIESKMRLDLSVGFNLVNRSYLHFYPIVCLALQHYFLM